MTLTGYFALNSVFEPVWLADTVIFGRDSSFWPYKIYADIRSGSQERDSVVSVNALLELGFRKLLRKIKYR